MGTDERWKKLEGIWRAALGKEPESRSAFVREACGGDTELAAEVESLLAHDGGSFLESPEEPTLTGRMIQQYAVLEKIGEGGMGVVFRARDTRLNRNVALKLLPSHQFPDPEWRRRLAKEARAASSLSHPNIVTVHDIVEEDGHDAIVMEFVAGQPLGSLIPMPVAEALGYAAQIAEGLAAAHHAGIIHRDIKPGNILVTSDGRIKIVDFGLAKITGKLDASAESGVIAGTAAYMSPEQAMGKAVDARSDVYSFGAVLFEMVTGRRALRGDFDAGGDRLPAKLATLIERCLQANPDRRWQSMDELLRALLEMRDGRGASVRRIGAIAAAVAVPLLAAAGWLGWQRLSRLAPNPVLTQISAYAGAELHPTFSPNGESVAFTWNGERRDNWDIYVKMVGDPTPLRLTTDPGQEGRPAWSPDGRWIAFLHSENDVDPAVHVVSPLGGGERKLMDFPAAGNLSWSPDAKWLAAGRSRQASTPENPPGIVLIPLGGGNVRRITSRAAPAFDRSPAFSPDGRRLAYAGCVSLNACDVFVVEMGDGFAPRGEPRQVTRQGVWIEGIAWFDSHLLYGGSLAGGQLSHLWKIDPDRGAPPERIEIAGVNAQFPAYSASSHRLAFSRGLSNRDIWRYRPGAAPEALIASSLDDLSPQYSPDGGRIAFASARSGQSFDIWVANADGTGQTRLTNAFGRGEGSPRWSPDGRWIAFESSRAGGFQDICVMQANGENPRRLESHASMNSLPSWSRDGKWIFFSSDRSGRNEIWRIPMTGGAAVQVSENGGANAVESMDGTQLFYTKPGSAALFTRPLSGGAERRLVDFLGVSRDFTVFGDGIYYGGRTEGGQTAFHFLSFDTGKSQLVTRVEGMVSLGFAVAPDRKTIAFAKNLVYGADLMLIDGFH